MGLVETEGLILKSYSLAEADKIVVFLTRQEGLVRGVARGAKRLKSRFGGGLEPFSVVRLEYNQKEERELVSIRQVDLIQSFFGQASDPDFLQKFAYLTEILIEFAPPHDPNENLYRMSKVCLEAASRNISDLEGITVYFELWLLRLAGYLPDWNRCDICKKSLNGQRPASLQINFHLLCDGCRKTRTNWSISPRQREIFNQAQKLPPAEFLTRTSDMSADLQEISRILKRIISHILGKEIGKEKVLVTGS